MISINPTRRNITVLSPFETTPNKKSTPSAERVVGRLKVPNRTPANLWYGELVLPQAAQWPTLVACRVMQVSSSNI